MLITIPSWKSFMYSEVWAITEYKDNCVYKTRNTGKCIEDKNKAALGNDYQSVSISPTKEEFITIDVVDAREFI